MKHNKERARRLFRALSDDLASICPEATNQSPCPLCLQQFGLIAIDDGKVSLEHIIPSSLGGKLLTLTCTRCNNTHGTELDRNLVSAMGALDAIEGRGTALKAVLKNPAGHVAANINWQVRTGNTTTIEVVGKASHPDGVDAIPNQLYDGAELMISLNLGFILDNYRRAVLRCAYLAAFERLGCRYLMSNSAEVVRRSIRESGQTPAVILQAYPNPEPARAACVMHIRGEEPFLFVMLRLRTKVTRYVAVFLPVCEWSPVVKLVENWRGLEVSGKVAGRHFDVTFGDDPIKRMVT